MILLKLNNTILAEWNYFETNKNLIIYGIKQSIDNPKVRNNNNIGGKDHLYFNQFRNVKKFNYSSNLKWSYLDQNVHDSLLNFIQLDFTIVHNKIDYDTKQVMSNVSNDNDIPGTKRFLLSKAIIDNVPMDIESFESASADNNSLLINIVICYYNKCFANLSIDGCIVLLTTNNDCNAMDAGHCFYPYNKQIRCNNLYCTDMASCGYIINLSFNTIYGCEIKGMLELKLEFINKFTIKSRIADINQVVNNNGRSGHKRNMLDDISSLTYVECDEWNLELNDIRMEKIENEEISCFNYILEKTNDNITSNGTNTRQCNMSKTIDNLIISFPNISLSIEDININNSDNLMIYYINLTECETIKLHNMYKLFYNAIPNQINKKYFNINDYSSKLGFTIEYEMRSENI